MDPLQAKQGKFNLNKNELKLMYYKHLLLAVIPCKVKWRKYHEI